MTRINWTAIAVIVVAGSGCVSNLNSVQKQEYAAMEAANVLVEEKSPSSGAWLGLLPGGGSFYSREPGMGIVNLLCWPLSILWDPVNGYDGAQFINYNATKQRLKMKKQAELADLEYNYSSGHLSRNIYLLEKKRIEDKYNFDNYEPIGFSKPSYKLEESVVTPARNSVDQTVPSTGMTKSQWQEHQLQQLMNEKGVSYEEYQRRYRAIVNQ
ncbi:hypothetical protein LX59_00041 [Azomonas agilis]|uniref:Lipoprotein n=1 Tax=Azomonas agilis TaxID=116849 RepID=A0A562J1T4_9GAMM|nr:hypothetical protein [Azomonas agilis]TWH77138.1 hypothetical protein LX59_00041 [Azomonas agilis]